MPTNDGDENKGFNHSEAVTRYHKDKHCHLAYNGALNQADFPITMLIEDCQCSAKAHLQLC